MSPLRPIFRDKSAASAVEFALVLPLLVLLFLGILDVGRLMYTWNMAEKATQMGVRYAVVTDFVPNTLNTAVFTDPPYNLVGGNPVPTSTFNETTCDNVSCANQGGWGYNSAAFGRVVNRMQLFYPSIGPANVQINYKNVGLGFAGDPSGPDVAALVTVKLRNIPFKSFTLLGGTVTLPPFSAALTMEDGAGTESN